MRAFGDAPYYTLLSVLLCKGRLRANILRDDPEFPPPVVAMCDTMCVTLCVTAAAQVPRPPARWTSALLASCPA